MCCLPVNTEDFLDSVESKGVYSSKFFIVNRSLSIKQNWRYLKLKIVMAMNKEFNFKNNFEMTISRKRNNWKWFLFQTHDPVHFSYFIQLFPLFHIYNDINDPPCQVWFNLVQRLQRGRFRCESLWRMTEAKWLQKFTWPLSS